jgi:hypothetical protein
MTVFFLDRFGGLGLSSGAMPVGAITLTADEHKALVLVDAFERHTKLTELRNHI